jgi:P-type E1-E2 ATPase
MILVLQILLCIIIAILNYAFLTKEKENHSYMIYSPYSIALDSVLVFCTYIVLINTMIPISLIVSIEIVKMSQSYFIEKDRLMFSDFRKKYCNVRSASLNEELGQIEYVFTDKTGTLTMNLMEFKIAVIGSKMYGDLGLIIKDPKRPPQ